LRLDAASSLGLVVTTSAAQQQQGHT
jgi:hypothetical protein